MNLFSNNYCSSHYAHPCIVRDFFTFKLIRQLTLEVLLHYVQNDINRTTNNQQSEYLMETNTEQKIQTEKLVWLAPEITVMTSEETEGKAPPAPETITSGS